MEMLSQQFLYSRDNYFEGLSISVADGMIKTSECTFISNGVQIPFEPIQAPITPDDDLKVNYRLFLLKGQGYKEFEYHYQFAYFDENGYGSAEYKGEKELVEVLADIVVSTSGELNGFTCIPSKEVTRA